MLLPSSPSWYTFTQRPGSSDCKNRFNVLLFSETFSIAPGGFFGRQPVGTFGESRYESKSSGISHPLRVFRMAATFIGRPKSLMKPMASLPSYSAPIVKLARLCW